MTHHSNISQAPLWTGEHLIRAKPKPPEPVQENPVAMARMHFSKRRPLVAEMHKSGKTIKEIAQETGVSLEVVRKDLGSFDLYKPRTQMKGDKDKARAAFRAFCKNKRVKQALIADTKDATPETVALREACVLAVHEASGASAALLAMVTGLSKPTAYVVLKRVKSKAT